MKASATDGLEAFRVGIRNEEKPTEITKETSPDMSKVKNLEEEENAVLILTHASPHRMSCSEEEIVEDAL